MGHTAKTIAKEKKHPVSTETEVPEFLVKDEIEGIEFNITQHLAAEGVNPDAV